jgi:hypothetical protein
MSSELGHITADYTKNNNNHHKFMARCKLLLNKYEQLEYEELEKIIMIIASELTDDIKLPCIKLYDAIKIFQTILHTNLMKSHKDIYMNQFNKMFVEYWRSKDDINYLHTHKIQLETEIRCINNIIFIRYKNSMKVEQCKCCEGFNEEHLYLLQRRLDYVIHRIDIKLNEKNNDKNHEPET